MNRGCKTDADICGRSLTCKYWISINNLRTFRIAKWEREAAQGAGDRRGATAKLKGCSRGAGGTSKAKHRDAGGASKA